MSQSASCQHWRLVSKMYFEDGREFLKERKGAHDVTVIDSSDPIGPALKLFTRDFYELTEEAVAVAQAEPPWLDVAQIKEMKANAVDFKRWDYGTAAMPRFERHLLFFEGA
eukprot:Polyplicarium_translucidae@DN3001_c1_g1_i1.p3